MAVAGVPPSLRDGVSRIIREHEAYLIAKGVFIARFWHPAGVRDVLTRHPGDVAMLNPRLLSANPPGWEGWPT